MRLRLVGSLAAVAVLALAGCSSSDSSGSSPTTEPEGTTTSVIAAPKGLPAFYAVPQPIPAKPGTIIKSEKVDAGDLNGSLYRVMYVSTTVDGDPTPVTGVIAVPKGEAPADGFPVLSWGHGTNGMADQCAPSLDPTSAAPLANEFLDKGWAVTASDYQGEGTPGLLPYVAGDSAARNTIDIVRAARALPDTKISKDYVVWGHSEGGHTAMFSLKIGQSYAPDLSLEGVVAGAPPSQFNLIYNYLKTSPYRYYLLMAGGGLNTAYGDERAPLDEILTPEGISLIPDLDKGCSGYLSDKYGEVDVSTVAKVDPFTVPKWKKVLEASDPQQFTEASPVPLLMIQGGNDEQIPVASTRILTDHLCDLGQQLERWVYAGQSHSGVIGPSSGDMIRWIGDRFTGDAAPGSFQPTGQADIDTTGCTAP